MNLENITYTGPEFDTGSKIIDLLPENLISLLKQINGFVQYDGGLHLRGVCNEPEWHSIESALVGKFSLSKEYPLIKTTDIPFAEDCVGDQFLIRDKKIIKLYSETGDVFEFDFGLSTFLEEASQYPVEFLGMEPLLQLKNEAVSLEPGQLISVYPPFCSKEAENGVSLKAISTAEVLTYLFKFSKETSGLKDDDNFEVKITE